MKCIHCGDKLPGGKKRCRRRDPFFKYAHTKHLASDEWAVIRRAVFAERGGKCERCGDPERLEVHHKNYCRLGNERHSDLLLLCGACHEEAHVDAEIARRQEAADREQTWTPPKPAPAPAPRVEPKPQAAQDDLFARGAA